MTFAGKIAWQVNDDFALSWDSETNTLSTLTSAQAPTAGARLGSLNLLGGDRILVNVSAPGSADPNQVGFTTDLDLGLTGSIAWDNNYNRGFEDAGDARSAYVGYEQGSSVYDPVTGLNWSNKTDSSASTVYEWNGYDATGAYVSGLGDVMPIGSGDRYRFCGANDITDAFLTADGWLYRGSNPRDAIIRFNMNDPTQWQSINVTTQELFLGVMTDGTVVTTSQSTGTGYGFVNKYAADSISWFDHLDVLNTTSLPSPTATLDTTPSGAAFNWYNNNLPGRGMEHPGWITADDQLIYTVIYPTFSGWGSPKFAFYSMDLTSGTITKIVDIPAHAYRSDGTQIADADADSSPDYFVDSTGSPSGIVVSTTSSVIVVPPDVPLLFPDLTAGLLDEGQRFL